MIEHPVEEVPTDEERGFATRVNDLFSTTAHRCAREMGRARTFIAAIVLMLVWALTGPLFGYSDTWQLIVNTGTTIATFLMMFLLQNTQNRDTIELNLKLDELIRSHRTAHNAMINLGELTERQLHHLQEEFTKVSTKRR